MADQTCQVDLISAGRLCNVCIRDVALERDDEGDSEMVEGMEGQVIVVLCSQNGRLGLEYSAPERKGTCRASLTCSPGGGVGREGRVGWRDGGDGDGDGDGIGR